MFEVEEIYEFIPEGMFADLDEFTIYANENGVSDFYEYMPQGMFESEEQFINGLKKKDVTGLPLEGGSLESSEIIQSNESVNVEEEEIEPNTSLLVDAGRKIKANTLTALGQLRRIPTAINEQIFTGVLGLTNPEALEKINALPREEREKIINAPSMAIYEGLGSLGGGRAIGVGINTQAGADLYNEYNKESKEIQDTYIKYDQSITEDLAGIQDLDLDSVGRGVSRISVEALGSLPSLVQAMVPLAGIGSIIAGSIAGKSAELQDEGDDLNYKTSLNSIISGTAEGVFEIVTKKIGGRFYKSLLNKGADATLKTVKDMAKRVSKDFAFEGLSEDATLLVQKMSDYALNDDEDAFKNSFSEFLETFLIGGVATGPLSVSGVGINRIRQNRRGNKIKKIVNESSYKDFTSTFSDPTIDPINKTQLDILNVPQSKQFLERTLDLKVAKNEITTEQKNNILNNYDKKAALAYELDGLNINQNDQIPALKLLAEKKELESQIAGKDEALVKAQKNRIQEINTELENISERSGAETTINELTKDDAVKALLEEGVDKPSDQDIINKLDELNKLQQDADTIKSPAEVLNEEQSEVGEAVVEGDNQPTEPSGEITQAQEETTVEPTQEGQDKTEVSETQEIKQPKTKLQKEIDKSLTPPIKKVTVNEKSALKDQIKLEAKAAREANLSAKKKIKKLTTAIKGIGKKGNLTPKQTTQIISKLNKTNIDSKVQVDKLVEFADKVSRDVDYSTKLSEASKVRDKAVSNLSGGNIGANRNFNAAISKMLNIPLESLNSEQLVEYTEFVKDYSKKRGQIKLGKAESITEKASSLYNKLTEDITVTDPVPTEKEINQTNKIVEEINNNDISGQQIIKDNKDYIENKLDNIDTPTLYNLVDKVNKDETKENSETVKKINDYAKIRQKLIDDISKSKVQTSKVDFYSQEFANRFEDVTKNDLVELTGSQLEQFQIHVNNINNGFYTHKANVLMNTIQANKQSNEVVPILSKLTKNKIARGASLIYGKIKSVLTGKSTQLQIARSNPLSVIDDVYGNFKGRQIYNNVFDPFGRSMSKFEAANSEVLAAVSSIESDIASRGGQTTNESVKKRYKITMYLTTLEAESNPNTKGIAPGVEWAKETVNSYKGKSGSIYQDADINILKELIKENEGKSAQEIYNTMDAGTKRATKKIQDVYSENTDKAIVAASIVRGDKLDAVDNYVHHYVSVNQADLKKEATDAIKSIEKDLSDKPSTQSATAKDRTKGVKPIDFDPINTLIRATSETNLDYYVTNTLRVGGKTVRSISNKTEGLDQTQEQGGRALRDAYNEMVQIAIGNNISSPFRFKIFQKTRELGYYAALSSVPRAGGELASNLAYVMTAAPKDFIKGSSGKLIRYSLNNNNEGLDIARNIGAKSFSRLFGKEKLTGSKAEKGGLVDKKSPTRAKGEIANEISRLTNSIPDKIKGVPIKLAEDLLSFPDKSISRPLFFGTLSTEFKKITNKDLDLKKLAENDLEYIGQNKKAILEATRAADTAVQRAASSTNAADVILKNQINRDDNALMQIYKTANSFMAKFSINEYATGRQAIASMIGQGEMTPVQGAQTLLALNLRMASYLIIGETLRNLMMMPFGADEEKDYESMLKQSVLGSALSLFSRRTLGNVPMIFINSYIENLNEKYGESLRGGKEYDDYRDSLVFSQIKQDRAVQDFYEIAVTSGLGPYAIYGRMLRDLTKLGANLMSIAEEEDFDKKEKLKGKTDWMRNIIQVSGNFGLLPFYKDIFSIYKTKKYKDNKKSKEDTGFY